MIAPIIVVGLVLACLLISAWLAKSRRSREALGNPGQHLRSVDVEAFRNLVDPAEEQFLRSRLEPAEFRKIQRERLLAAVEYITAAARNARILFQLAEAARHNHDPEVVHSAEKLSEEAARLRLYAFQAIPRLYLAMVFPGSRISSLRVAESYEQMTRELVSLDLRYPTRGVSAAL